MTMYEDEKIHNKEKFAKYVNKYCSKCEEDDLIKYQDCYYRCTTLDIKYCLLEQYKISKTVE